MSTDENEIFDSAGEIKPHIHREHHIHIHREKTAKELNREMLAKIKVAVFTWLAIGTIGSFFALLWWSFKTFVAAGGA